MSLELVKSQNTILCTLLSVHYKQCLQTTKPIFRYDANETKFYLCTGDMFETGFTLKIEERYGSSPKLPL